MIKTLLFLIINSALGEHALIIRVFYHFYFADDICFSN